MLVSLLVYVCKYWRLAQKGIWLVLCFNTRNQRSSERLHSWPFLLKLDFDVLFPLGLARLLKPSTNWSALSLSTPTIRSEPSHINSLQAVPRSPRPASPLFFRGKEGGAKPCSEIPYHFPSIYKLLNDTTSWLGGSSAGRGAVNCVQGRFMRSSRVKYQKCKYSFYVLLESLRCRIQSDNFRQCRYSCSYDPGTIRISSIY